MGHANSRRSRIFRALRSLPPTTREPPAGRGLTSWSFCGAAAGLDDAGGTW